MLAQSFLSAAALEITEPQREALQKVLVLLETGKLQHSVVHDEYEDDAVVPFTGHFNMINWKSETENGCGTAACIGGTAELISGVKFGKWWHHNGLDSLFAPSREAVPYSKWHDITTQQAARALRSYLTTGDPKWDEAVA